MFFHLLVEVFGGHSFLNAAFWTEARIKELTCPAQRGDVNVININQQYRNCAKLILAFVGLAMWMRFLQQTSREKALLERGYRSHYASGELGVPLYILVQSLPNSTLSLH